MYSFTSTATTTTTTFLLFCLHHQQHTASFSSTTTTTFLLFSLHHSHQKHSPTACPRLPPPPMCRVLHRLPSPQPHFYCFPSTTTTTTIIPCKQWFLQAGSYATKGEKPLRASVSFFDRAAVQPYGGIN